MRKSPFTDDRKFDPRKTLFVTDLDGTLLTGDARLPSGAGEMIRDLHRRGVRLTYSTARTIRSAAFILKGLPFPAPVALMNGVLLRDMNEGRYVDSQLFSEEAAQKILSAGGEPFVYTLTKEGELFTAYRRLAGAYMEPFLRERVEKYGKPFRKLERFETLVEEGQRIIYFCYLGNEDELRTVHEEITALRSEDGSPFVKCAFYPDHRQAGLWYLEVFATTASKGNACRRLREITGAETIVSFGDNGNDLPMFAESDYAFAVENASEAIKSAADGVIPGGLGVLKFIRDHVGE